MQLPTTLLQRSYLFLFKTLEPDLLEATLLSDDTTTTTTKISTFITLISDHRTFIPLYRYLYNSARLTIKNYI